jgi:hypothetical protein
MFCLLTVAVGAGDAQWVQQGNKLVGIGGVGQQYQGTSAAVSSDGNTAIVGGRRDNGDVGAAWVYTRSGGVWSQQGNKLVGTGALGSAQQGDAVALSSDGNTAVICGPYDNGSVGAAWVFIRSGGVWSQQGSKLVGTGAVGVAYQGVSVSLSADGNTAIIGGSSDNSRQGAAWVFTRSGGVWSQQGSKLVGTGAVDAAAQGSSVSISSDASTVMLGGPDDNYSLGAAWVFTRSGGVWSQQGDKLIGSSSTWGRSLGESVALSSDGNTAIVGGPTDSSNVGASWVFVRSAGVWSQQGNKLVGFGGVGPMQSQGISVSISGDGNTGVIGAEWDNTITGAAWVFVRANGVWTQVGGKLVGTGGAGRAYQGASVSISSDGNTVMVGGPTDSTLVGAAWAYARFPSHMAESFGEGVDNFNLEQNYPNPFNPSTNIKYQIPGASHVTLKLFDILGGEVAALVDEVKQPGTYTVQFDGSRLASGVYFYRLRAGDFVDVKKLILLK